MQTKLYKFKDLPLSEVFSHDKIILEKLIKNGEKFQQGELEE